MVEQDGPAEIDRITLRSIVCLHCRQQFPMLADATVHDSTCPEHPAVKELTKVMDAERREQARLIGDRNAALQQLAIAKRLVAACVELVQNIEPWPDEALRECLQSLGIVREVIYDPATHGEILDAEEGEPWLILAEEWREG